MYLTIHNLSKVVRRFLSMVVFPNRHCMRQIGAVAISLVLYTLLVVAYSLAVLRWLNEAMAQLFRENLDHYAIASVLLILGQAILLDLVTSGLLRLGKWVNGR
jgi:hypothetical protein